jgi:glutathione S-transferase
MQVPTLVEGDRVLFGTRLIVDYLLAKPADSLAGLPPFAARTTRAENHWQDAQLLVALETLVSALVSRSYLIWTGATHRADAPIPLDLAERELDRARRLLDWLEDRASPEGFWPGFFALPDIWLLCTIAWTEARIAIPWHGRPKLEAIIERHRDRASVRATVPPPWSPKA